MRGEGERRQKLREDDRVRDIEEEKRRLENIIEKSVRNDLSEKRKRRKTLPKPSSSGAFAITDMERERKRECECEEERKWDEKKKKPT